jgi:hypothetical protein
MSFKKGRNLNPPLSPFFKGGSYMSLPLKKGKLYVPPFEKGEAICPSL